LKDKHKGPKYLVKRGRGVWGEGEIISRTPALQNKEAAVVE